MINKKIIAFILTFICTFSLIGTLLPSNEVKAAPYYSTGDTLNTTIGEHYPRGDIGIADFGSDFTDNVTINSIVADFDFMKETYGIDVREEFPFDEGYTAYAAISFDSAGNIYDYIEFDDGNKWREIKPLNEDLGEKPNLSALDIQIEIPEEYNKIKMYNYETNTFSDVSFSRFHNKINFSYSPEIMDVTCGFPYPTGHAWGTYDYSTKYFIFELGKSTPVVISPEPKYEITQNEDPSSMDRWWGYQDYTKFITYLTENGNLIVDPTQWRVESYYKGVNSENFYNKINDISTSSSTESKPYFELKNTYVYDSDPPYVEMRKLAGFGDIYGNIYFDLEGNQVKELDLNTQTLISALQTRTTLENVNSTFLPNDTDVYLLYPIYEPIEKATTTVTLNLPNVGDQIEYTNGIEYLYVTDEGASLDIQSNIKEIIENNDIDININTDIPNNWIAPFVKPSYIEYIKIYKERMTLEKELNTLNEEYEKDINPDMSYYETKRADISQKIAQNDTLFSTTFPGGLADLYYQPDEYPIIIEKGKIYYISFSGWLPLLSDMTFVNCKLVDNRYNENTGLVEQILSFCIPYDISYDLGGGTFNNEENTINNYDGNKEITLPQPIRRGYKFLGWTGVDLTEPTLNVTIPVGSIGDRVYTANWKANFNSDTNSDTDNTNQSINHNIPITPSSSPSISNPEPTTDIEKNKTIKESSMIGQTENTTSMVNELPLNLENNTNIDDTIKVVDIPKTSDDTNILWIVLFIFVGTFSGSLIILYKRY